MVKKMMAAALLFLSLAAGCAPLAGHDNGEAYERYTEQMDEAGMPYNGYW